MTAFNWGKAASSAHARRVGTEVMPSEVISRPRMPHVKPEPEPTGVRHFCGCGYYCTVVRAPAGHAMAHVTCPTCGENPAALNVRAARITVG